MDIYLFEIGMLFIYQLFILATVGLIGWLVYDLLFLRGVSLKEELFQNNSLPMWIEFTGGFLAPVLFLVTSIIEPSGKFIYHGKIKDILIAVSYTAAYIIIFSILRYLAEKIIYLIGKLKYTQSVSLKDQIFGKKNFSASLFSISISVLVLGMLLQENILVESVPTNLIRIGMVFFITLGLYSVFFTYFIPRNQSMFRNIFIDANISTGILTLGNIVAINLIIFSCFKWVKIPPDGWLQIVNLIDVTLLCCLLYLIMLVVISITRKLISRIFKVNIGQELYEQDSTGYALFESSFYILLSTITINGFLV